MTFPKHAIRCKCGAWWTGLRAGHCSACHRTFTCIEAFDKHRTGSHAKGTRACLDPSTITTESGEPALVKARKQWDGWALPGTWSGPVAHT